MRRFKQTHWTTIMLLVLAVSHLTLSATEYGGQFEEVGIADEEINFEGCTEIVCDPLKIRRYTEVVHAIRSYFRKYNRPALPLSLEAKMMVISNAIRISFKEHDFVGFYYFNPERGDSALELAPYSTIIKTPQPLFRKSEGIVGKCWETLEAQVAKNIPKMPGYITFDGRSKAEIAIPSFDLEGNFTSVLFIYSELAGVFDETDVVCLEEVINYLDY